MTSNTLKKNFKIVNFSMGNTDYHNQTFYLQTDLIGYIDEFIKRGVFASKSEFIRAAIREKIIKLLDEDAILTKWREEIEFNKYQDEKVRIQGKEYNVVRRLV